MEDDSGIHLGEKECLSAENAFQLFLLSQRYRLPMTIDSWHDCMHRNLELAARTEMYTKFPWAPSVYCCS